MSWFDTREAMQVPRSVGRESCVMYDAAKLRDVGGYSILVGAAC